MLTTEIPVMHAYHFKAEVSKGLLVGHFWASNKDENAYLRTYLVRHGGLLVDSMPFIRRAVGSNPALATTWGPWASPSLAVACGALV